MGDRLRHAHRQYGHFRRAGSGLVQTRQRRLLAGGGVSSVPNKPLTSAPAWTLRIKETLIHTCDFFFFKKNSCDFQRCLS